jgi:hypothetical protein
MTKYMNLILIFLVTLVVATGANAKGADKGRASIQASQHPDGLLFDVKGGDVDLQLDISGPGKAMYSKHYAYAESVFFNINNASGVALPDGLYKYEARPVPAVTISRAESSRMKDRNVLHGKTDAKLSPVSGTFRIVNGGVVDPHYDEYGIDTPIRVPTETTE